MGGLKRVSRKIGRGLGTGIPDDDESVKRAIAEITTASWVTADTMSTALKIGKNTGYALAKEGRFGAFKVGAHYRIPCAPLREALHIPAVSNAHEQVAA